MSASNQNIPSSDEEDNNDNQNPDQEGNEEEGDENEMKYMDEEVMAEMAQMAEEQNLQMVVEYDTQGYEDEMDDFQTFNESEFGEGDEYCDEGQVLQLDQKDSDAIGQFNEHADSIYCLDYTITSSDNNQPKGPGDILFASGDGKDKAYIWKLKPIQKQSDEPTDTVMADDAAEESKSASGPMEPKEAGANKLRFEAERVAELKGHTETVEYIKFDSSGKWLVTGGMNNILRVWDVQNEFKLKKTLDQIPQEDLNFVEWHPKAPVLLTGGKDYMIWLVNALNGKIMANLIGHEDEVVKAEFTKMDGGKQVISVSADGTTRVWSPLDSNCLKVIRNGKDKVSYHEGGILCCAVAQSKTLVMTGGADGKVFGANYVSGESTGCIGQHKNEVEAVAMHHELKIGASAGIDQEIFIFDLAHLTIRHKLTPTIYGGFTMLRFSNIPMEILDEEGKKTGEKIPMLLAASTLGDFFAIEVRTGEVQRQLKGHAAPINYFIEVNNQEIVGENNGWIVTAGDDNQCNVFELN